MRTLREVIDDKTIVSPLKGDRLQLAVRLASSLLQLHDTEWLPEVWGKDNVLVSDEITTDRYAVKSAFTRIVQISSPTAVPAVTPAQCSASLVCLGIVLVELLLWKPFEEIQSPREKLLIPFGELLSEIKTIERLITESVIQGEGGKKYAVAVRQCTGNLDIDDPRLSHDEFKNAVYARIVQPLEEHLKEFNGWEELPELL